MAKPFLTKKGIAALPGEYVVYRFYDAQGILLYIGMSSSLILRLCGHQNEKPWWPDVARIDFEYFPDRWAASSFEKAAIWNEDPLYNIQSNRLNVAPWMRTFEFSTTEEWWESMNARIPEGWADRIAKARGEISDAACRVFAVVVVDSKEDGTLYRGADHMAVDAHLDGEESRDRQVKLAIQELMKAKLVGRRSGKYVLQYPSMTSNP